MSAMFVFRSQLLIIVTASLLLAEVATAFSAEENKGRQVFLAQCADCHGPRGEGVASVYPQPLVGDLSVKELTHYISATMPEGEPEKCVGEDAAAVAAYIHNEFYSVIAQVRNTPPKIDLARLTVRQYRNSLTDLAGSFVWQGSWDEKRGIEGKYYKTHSRKNENRMIERVDPEIRFQFGEGSPDPEKIDGTEFVVDWNGGVLAPETGYYEICLKTENAGQLWFNDMRQPLIDARVKSGDQTEYRESIYLLGGRVYPLKVEWLKSKNEKTASVEVLWKPPRGAEEVIPLRNLSPNRFNFQVVVATDFPPDDKSVGYERGVAVSKEWNDATTHGAIEFADIVMSRISDFAKLPKEEDQHAEKLKAFCVDFAGRAFRRPLSDELKAFFVERQFAATDPYTATKRVILLSLKSPRFLFPGASQTGWDDYQTAEWLALSLWDSVPDEALRKAAQEQKLQTKEQIEAQARRMVANLRARSKVRDFFHQWLQFDHYHELSKSGTHFPGFDKSLVADLRTSLDLFLESVVWSETSDYRQLLLADEIYLNGRLAQFYGVNLPEEAGFERVSFEKTHRAGLVSHPFLLAGLAYEDTSSPIHRGVFVARSLLGRFLKPPPIAVAPVPADLHPGMTTRERVHEQTSSTTCYACHAMINPLGFSLEHFDAAGRFRETDRDKPVNAAGVYLDRQGNENPFDGARELAVFIAGSQEAHSAFTEQLFQYLIKQPVQAFGPDLHDQLKQRFREQNFHIQKLLADIATQSVLVARDRALNSTK